MTTAHRPTFKPSTGIKNLIFFLNNNNLNKGNNEQGGALVIVPTRIYAAKVNY